MAGNGHYVNWLLDFVCTGSQKRNYSNLFLHLFNTDFIYIYPMDSNREYDGLELRSQYEADTGNRLYLDDKPCSVLEMMVALAIRCEEDIMYNDEYGNRTGEWFWVMIYSMELDSMTNHYYGSDYTDFIVYRMLNREYDYDGSGGLFRIIDPPEDMRKLEIWYQALYYLNGVFERSAI